jgi:hypothetical protein
MASLEHIKLDLQSSDILSFNTPYGLIHMMYYRPVVFFGSIWFMPYFSTYGVSLFPLLLGYYSLKVSDLGWAEHLGGQSVYWLLIYLSRVNQWWQYNNLKIFLMFFVMSSCFDGYIYVLGYLILEYDVEVVTEVS